jgi:hypothetical protein
MENYVLRELCKPVYHVISRPVIAEEKAVRDLKVNGGVRWLLVMRGQAKLTSACRQNTTDLVSSSGDNLSRSILILVRSGSSSIDSRPPVKEQCQIRRATPILKEPQCLRSVPEDFLTGCVVIVSTDNSQD